MIGIIGAMEIEVQALKSMIDTPETRKISGIEFVSGKIHGKEVVVTTCGVGKVFAAIAAEAMILSYSPELIINSGVAGSTDERLGIADIAIAADVVQHDMDTTPLGDPPGLLSGINIVNIPCEKRAVDVLEECVKEENLPYLIGRIATGDEFVSTIARKKELSEKFGAVACEMEGGSIGHVCYVNGVGFVALRAISDSLSDESGMEFSEFVGIAAANSVKIIDKFLKKY